ncbi:Protein held out wings [Eumeta japonica]|uniref:Protein held out wings n=1 Tax=Eumeta variegata TaxID=151549 RepID=A0A4C1WDN8_EUMVA|nr:Protein held out wings [Eumeta japonica]
MSTLIDSPRADLGDHGRPKFPDLRSETELKWDRMGPSFAVGSHKTGPAHSLKRNLRFIYNRKFRAGKCFNYTPLNTDGDTIVIPYVRMRTNEMACFQVARASEKTLCNYYTPTQRTAVARAHKKPFDESAGAALYSPTTSSRSGDFVILSSVVIETLIMSDNNNPSTQSIADYLAQLLKDRKQLAAFPNVFMHMERLLDEGRSIFHSIYTAATHGAATPPAPTSPSPSPS